MLTPCKKVMPSMRTAAAEEEEVAEAELWLLALLSKVVVASSGEVRAVLVCAAVVAMELEGCFWEGEEVEVVLRCLVVWVLWESSLSALRFVPCSDLWVLPLPLLVIDGA